MKKEKTYPQIDPNLPYQRTWLIFYIVIWIIGFLSNNLSVSRDLLFIIN